MSGAFRQDMLIAGGGIGGLAAAIACHRAGWRVRIFEQAPGFAEVGAGLQLGPNAGRILQDWGLGEALAAVAAFPQALQVRRAASHQSLATLPLGAAFKARYGAPYATLHRADLHALLFYAVRGAGDTVLHPGTRIETLRSQGPAVAVRVARPADAADTSPDVEGDALVLADGVWSGLRAQCLPHDMPPQATGHLAYRTLLPQADLPAALRSDEVTVWLGHRLHAVAYPVRRGEWLNLVVLAEAAAGAQPPAGRWNAPADPDEVARVLAQACGPLRALQEAAPEWRRWMLCDRPPLPGPDGMAVGRIALLGDAAHPMLPYLAQGAGMAIEDAAELQRMLAMEGVEVPLQLRRYAMHRWQRVARVQRTARRNARVFHARGPVQWGRDVALRLLGPRLLDQPWLYG